MSEKEREIFEGYFKTLSDVLLTEISGLKEDLKEIKEEVKRINGQVREVCEWKAGHQAVHDTKERGGANTLKIISVVIAFIGMASGMYVGFRNTNDKVDMIKRNYEIQERYLQWKFGEVPVNPTTRGKVIDINQAIDSIR